MMSRPSDRRVRSSARNAERAEAAPGSPGEAGAQGTLEAPDYLPISYLNALLYCPRRFYYEYAEGEMLVNEHVLQGQVYHRVADAGGTSTADDGTRSLRRIYVFSDRLRISGIIDVVEAVPGNAGDDEPEVVLPAGHPFAASPPAAAQSGTEQPSQQAATLYPVEYKKGSARGGQANDHVQLCAQGLCLEERTGQPIAGGYVFSFDTRRRTWIPFTPALRAQTEATITRAFTLLREGHLPPPLPAELDRKCRECSLEPLCLPREVRALTAIAR